MSDLTTGTYWNLTCQSARNHAASMAAGCRREAAELIHREAKAFCDRKPPDTGTELHRRQQQRTFLTSRIGNITHADLMARTRPNVSDQIMEAVKLFLERVSIDEWPYEEATALTSTISSICYPTPRQVIILGRQRRTRQNRLTPRRGAVTP
jgi:hypothetical protein